MAEPTHIRVRNARQHNLRGVDIDVPRDALVVFTGVSGSGKSSLVFDTIHQEGQRRFMESLSAYARQFLGQMERPLVDSVDGVSPTISIDQKTVNRNPRSTVGTTTEIFDHLRLLFARLGQPHCPVCDAPIDRLGVDDVVEAVLEEGEGRKVQLLAPVVQDRKGEYRKEMEGLARDGWIRARVDGETVRLDEPPTLERYKKHTIEVVVDRLVPSQADRPRLVEAVEAALALGQQVVTVLLDDTERTFATARACPRHPEQAVPELEPRLFSFNSPQGACPACEGLGELVTFEVDRLMDPDAPVRTAFRAFNDEGRLPFGTFDTVALAEVAAAMKADVDASWSSWTTAQRERLLHGDATIRWHAGRKDGAGRETRARVFTGLLPMVERVWHYTRYKGFERFRSRQPCPDCEGARLGPIPRAVRFRDRGIHTLTRLTVSEATAFFEGVGLEGDEATIGALLLKEIRDRLRFLHEVGVGYLTLDRSANSLSGGESQRIRLASQIGSGLQGVTYVLDEPSIGLHHRDNQRLIDAMRRLRDRGNTVLVVEHDAETMLAADHVVEVGPGAGREGGLILASGSPAAFLASDCVTAAYLRGERSIPLPEARRATDGDALVVRGARLHNLHDVDARFPLGVLTVVTGVSGSGKSSLVFGALEPTLMAALAGSDQAEGCRAVEGLEHIDKVIRINQQPIGRTPRSNPATYTGAMNVLRDLFAATEEARARGYTKSRFSFNVKGGRCEDCQGAGVKTVEMQFLPDVQVPCDTCGGKRFNRETLDVRFKGLTIHEVLELPIREAHEVFGKIPKLARILGTLVDVGLDYVTLGQPSTTLSGGEAQRMKLASELQRPATGRTLYLLDEPTTGLHFQDVAKLLAAIQALVDQGNTVLVVEHDTHVIKCADHVIDMGPDGGSGGGFIIGEGTPEHIASLDTPTGHALAAVPELGGALPVAADGVVVPLRQSRPTAIAIRGARKHNLRHVDVDLPHGAFTVITGVSGSGKSSLAFDTVFAEGQRRYVESLSTYARRFLGQVEKAPLDLIEGLQPAIAIDQANASSNPRSTVATVTEIHDVLRLLYARLGQPHCPHCQRALTASSPSAAARALADHAPGAGWLTTDLVPDDQPAERRMLLTRDGWRRLLTITDGAPTEVDLDDASAEPLLAEGAVLVVDRLDPARSRARTAEAIAAAYRLGHGRARFQPRGGGDGHVFTESIVCPVHGQILPELTPRHFSFNARIGMCRTCEGVGTRTVSQPEAVFRGHGSLWQALDPRVAAVVGKAPRTRALLERVLQRTGTELDSPVSRWPDDVRRMVLYGDVTPCEVSWTRGRGQRSKEITETLTWPGLLPILREAKVEVSWTTVEQPCDACGGGRLSAESLAVTLQGHNLAALAAMTVDALRVEVDGWTLAGEHEAIAERPRLELVRRLRFLADVGLGYLTLDRRAATLSGGESQRIRLASQLGSGLTGVTYVLDEPTIGLHPRDTARLLESLQGLRDLGNTVLVVEHDPDTIAVADHVIDMGPAAGRYGGTVVSSGTPAEIRDDPDSITGGWLSGRLSVPRRARRRQPKGSVQLREVRTHNLRSVDLELPLGVWTAVTGVSGSGKSSLIMDTLAPALKLALGQQGSPGPYGAFEIDGTVDGLVLVDQSPLGRTPRSTPATYVGVMDPLRKLYAQTPGARARGWKPGRFSFNSPGGRCEACEGRGAVLIEMHFLPDVWVTCGTCRGRRFQRDTLEVRFKGHTISDALALRADEALEVFSNQRAIHKRLKALCDVGLGYITMGQPATTLSGGEAQRVKLAAELISRKGKRMYVLDEPTTGLHLSDVAKLIEVLHALADKGHTVVTIEHHLDMIRQADHVVELGPDGGTGGGTIVAAGTPEQVIAARTATGVVLERAAAP